jgi:hypothetical protein
MAEALLQAEAAAMDDGGLDVSSEEEHRERTATQQRPHIVRDPPKNGATVAMWLSLCGSGGLDALRALPIYPHLVGIAPAGRVVLPPLQEKVLYVLSY